MKAGIVGASGYTGAELLRLLAGHPDLEVARGDGPHPRRPGRWGEHTPSLAAAYPGLVYEESDPGRLDGLDVVFCALPHGESQRIVPELRGPRRAGRRPGGRLPPARPVAVPALVRRGARRPRAPGRGRLRAARAVPRRPGRGRPSSPPPGCYPTAAGLALAPLVRPGLVEPTGIVVDAASGRLGRRPRPQGVAALRDGRRGLRRLRAADPPPHARDGADPRGPGAVHPAPGAHGARHPGHLLRAARPARPALVDGRGHGRAARGLRRRAVRRRDATPRPPPRRRRAPTRRTSRRASTRGPDGW